MQIQSIKRLFERKIKRMKIIISSTFIALSLTLFLTSESHSTDKNLLETGEFKNKITNINLVQPENGRAVLKIYAQVNFNLALPWKSSEAHLLKGHNDAENELIKLRRETYVDFDKREQDALAEFIKVCNDLNPEDKKMGPSKYYEIILRQMFDSVDLGLKLFEKAKNIKGLENETIKDLINEENEFLGFKIKLNKLKQKSFDIHN